MKRLVDSILRAYYHTAMQSSRKRALAIAFLLVFTPFFAESVASTNTPWFVFVQPQVLAFFILVYGLPILLIRELSVRRSMGAGQFLLLGAVYAMFNEGLIASTWFKPDALGFHASELVSYSGVNTMLVVGHLVFHTVFSMLVPIALSRELFPQLNAQPLLSRRASYLSFGLLTVVALATTLPHVMYASQHVVLLGLMLAVIVMVFLLPSVNRGAALARRSLGAGRLVALGASFSVAFFASYFFVPKVQPLVALACLALLYGATWVAIRRLAPFSANDTWRILPFFIGLLVPQLLVSFTSLPTGQPIVVVLIIGWFAWLYRRAKVRGSSTTQD
jgi:hypothetical protein